jgi:catalase
VAILAADGFNHDELMAVQDALKQAGASCKIVSMYRGMLKGHNGKEVEVDKNYVATASVLFDALYVPGGARASRRSRPTATRSTLSTRPSSTARRSPPAAKAWSCSPPRASRASLADQRAPGDVVSDKGVVTAGSKADRKPSPSPSSTRSRMHRHWDREEKMHVPA